MKEQLNKLFRKELFSDPLNHTGSVEPLSNTEDAYYKYSYSKGYNPRFRKNNRYNTNNKDSGNQISYLRKVNLLNKDGEMTKCDICGSINYWTKSCPNLCKIQMKIKKETNITLIGECMDTLIGKHKVRLF